MAWEIAHDKSLGLVEVVLAGVNTAEELREATVAGIARVRKTRATRGLINAVKQVEAPAMAELLELPSQYDDERLSHDTRIAYLGPERPELHDAAEFFETVCVNRGWAVRRFADREEAISWLTSDSD